MRTPNLQYLYLQKPVTLVVVLCIISIIPWIILGDFSTKGEPREAAVAISMLESGNWVLPYVYANEFAYKPPLAHWLMAVFSYPQGYVSEFTSRLPSAIAFITLIASTLMFFGKRLRFQQAFISVLFLLTCLEIHRAGMTTRVDMLLSTFIVLALYRLYKWEEYMHLKGLPVFIPFFLSCAILTKGPVGAILPLFIFGVYLLVLNKYSLLTVFKSLLYIGVASLFLPMIWYIAAWKQGGDEFLNLVLAENFGRFFSISNLDINYNLGHENGVWYNFQTLLTGFIPWTLLFVFSLFGIKMTKPDKPFKETVKNIWTRFRSSDKVVIFSVVALVCVVFFYSIPSSKRSVYLIPAYPFIALFLAQYALYLTEYRRLVTRFFAGFLASLVSLILVMFVLIMVGAINPVSITEGFTSRESTLDMVRLFTQVFASPSWITITILLLTLLSVIIVWYQMFKKINIKILYSTIALAFAVNMIVDGVVMYNQRAATSSRPFAEQIMKDYPLNKENVFVTNNLLEFPNLYGMNFYMGNMFHDIAYEQPQEGYFLVTTKSADKVIKKYGDQYEFTHLTSTPNRIADVRDKIALYSIRRK
ncbi:glycosyltransferase family 39 protein [Massilibacteroides sp.]|uniref:ArnT family glycosyltransferase n=1 Tax=Massilibacteroides sp. TaxID=2034766 RepID=UPI00261B4701|nr:glycosyltransferase family 39 protein [Massilibacteroides sp.]MDD4514369.1 glycosyltransferase family 39 protein [Massilibacteroides sp.]